MSLDRWVPGLVGLCMCWLVWVGLVVGWGLVGFVGWLGGLSGWLMARRHGVHSLCRMLPDNHVLIPRKKQTKA